MLIGDSELPEASLARLRQAGLLLLVEGEYRVNESFYAETLEAEQRQKPQGLQRYLSLGKLEGLPQNRTDREALLRLLCGRLFEPGKHYSEAEVNGLLRVVSDDVPGLRRAMVDYDYLARVRDGSDYWLSEFAALP